MQLSVKPYHRSPFPVGGILIKSADAAVWIKEIQQMQLTLQMVQVYPVPGSTPDSVWGCLVIPAGKISKELVGKHELCQSVTAHLFIPERAIIHPVLTVAETEQFFGAGITVFHPDFGFAELTEEVAWEQLIRLPAAHSCKSIKPQPGPFVPDQIKSFRIQPVPPEEVLKNLEENVFPKQEKLEDKPLSPYEKIRLSLYKKLFSPGEGTGEGTGTGNPSSGIFARIGKAFGGLPGDDNKWVSRMKQDFEDLEQRNKEQVDRLLDLFRDNPEEALKYAIPLNETGSSRGDNDGRLSFSHRWSDFSLTGNSSNNTGGGAVNLGDHYYELQKQYTTTAEELIRRKEYQKAAFVYMKLLKNYRKAAETLEAGRFYQEAATIYLKYVKDQKSAAVCYEKGRMIPEAIELYKELGDHEKVGDLYLDMHMRKEANIYFEKVADGYKEKSQYVKASLVYKNKIGDEQLGQASLLEGWRHNKDAFNCLNNYFSNMQDVKELGKEIKTVYAADVTEQNRETFLRVLRYEYNRKNELAEDIKEIAYEVIAAQISVNPSIVTELKEFNPADKELVKDTIRFKVKMPVNKI